jgi:hypothetical protein
MSDKVDIDNIRYSIETQEFFQRQVEEAVNNLINKNNSEIGLTMHNGLSMVMGMQATLLLTHQLLLLQ